eukprot:2783050-Heterocapsa_arctica.AAC.2
MARTSSRVCRPGWASPASQGRQSIVDKGALGSEALGKTQKTSVMFAQAQAKFFMVSGFWTKQ